MTTQITAGIEVAEAVNSTILPKQDIVAAIAVKFGVTKKLAKAIVTEVLDTIHNGVVNDNKEFRFPGVGTLKCKILEAGEARNPQNGNTVAVGARSKVVLKNKPMPIQA